MDPSQDHPNSMVNSPTSVNEDVSMASSSKTMEELLCASVQTMAVSEPPSGTVESMNGIEEETNEPQGNQSSTQNPLDDFTLSFTQCSSDIRALGGCTAHASKSEPFDARETMQTVPETPVTNNIFTHAGALEPSPLTITPAIREPTELSSTSFLSPQTNILMPPGGPIVLGATTASTTISFPSPRTDPPLSRPPLTSTSQTVTIGFDDKDPTKLSLPAALELLKKSSSLFYVVNDRLSSLLGPFEDAKHASLPGLLQRNPGLRCLCLCDTPLYKDGVLAMAKYLEKGTSLEQLYLRYCSIDHEQVIMLAKALESNQTLRTLDLAGNSIRSFGALARFMEINAKSALRHLDLSLNSINDDDVKRLAQSLGSNQTLQVLDLMGNSISNEGATALAKSVECNKGLLRLNLTRNWIGSLGALSLATALERNVTMQQLDLQRNAIGDDGAIAIASALERNTTLQKLNLSETTIGKVGALALGAALDRNKAIYLDLRRNTIGNEAAAALRRFSSRLFCRELTRFSFYKEDRVPIDENSITVHDVVGGVDSTGSNWPGNVAYRDLIKANKSYHHSLGGNHKEKTRIRNMIINDVLNRNGRFIRKVDERFFLLTEKEAEEKVNQALKPRKSRAKTP